MTERTSDLPRLGAAFRIEVGAEVRLRHLANMRETLQNEPVAAPAMPPFGLRRRLAALAAAFVVFAAPATALAAEDSVPGELLYPVKQVTERIRSVVDEDIIATHRVEELETFIVRNADVTEVDAAVRRAETAVAELEDPGEWPMRLERVMRRAQLQYGQELSRPSDGEGGGAGQQQDQQPSGSGGESGGHGAGAGDGGGGSGGGGRNHP